MIPQPDSRSGCAACQTASCCIDTRQGLTGADLLRLCDGRGVTPTEFVAFWAVTLREAGDDAIFLADDHQAYELGLAKHAVAGANGGDQRCVFLSHVATGANRCGVYSHRPMVCRLFPTDLTRMGVMVFNPDRYCPPRTWSITRLDLATTRLVHLRSRVERAIYHAFLARWNRHLVPRGAQTRQARQARFLAELLDSETRMADILEPVWADPARSLAFQEAWSDRRLADSSPLDRTGAHDEAAARALFGGQWQIVEALQAALDETESKIAEED